MKQEILEMLIKLGLIEAYQSYLEGDEEYNSFYYRDNENTEDDFFREDLEEE